MHTFYSLFQLHWTLAVNIKRKTINTVIHHYFKTFNSSHLKLYRNWYLIRMHAFQNHSHNTTTNTHYSIMTIDWIISRRISLITLSCMLLSNQLSVKDREGRFTDKSACMSVNSFRKPSSLTDIWLFYDFAVKKCLFGPTLESFGGIVTTKIVKLLFWTPKVRTSRVVTRLRYCVLKSVHRYHL